MAYPNAYPTLTANDITLQPGATYSLTELFTYNPAVGNTGDPIAYVAGFTTSITYGYTLTGTRVDLYNYYSYTMEGDAGTFGATFGGTQPFADGTIHIDEGWTAPISISFSFNVGFFDSDRNNEPWLTGTVSSGGGTFAVGPPHDPIQVTVHDAFVTEGAPGETSFIAFKVELSAPVVEGSLVVSLSAVNPIADPLKPDQLQYMDASPATHDLSYPLPSPLSVTFDGNSGTVQEIRIPIIGDNFTEPDEKFTVKITAPAVTQDGRIVNVTDDVAIGMIYNDDGNNTSPKAVVTWAAPQEIPEELRSYVTADIEAAVTRLNAALGGALPTLEIVVQPYDLPGGYLAAGIPVFTSSIAGLKDDGAGKSAKGLTMVLPLASYEKLTGVDLNNTGPDLKVFVDLDALKQIYSGSSTSVDGTSLMLHELMHGLGVGVSGRAQYETPWGHYEQQRTTGLYFVGSETLKFIKQGVHLTSDGAHLWNNDLMDGGGVEPNESLSLTHVAILNDLGYGKKSPMWWTDHKASVPTGVDEPSVPSSFVAAAELDGGNSFASLLHHREMDWALV